MLGTASQAGSYFGDSTLGGGSRSFVGGLHLFTPFTSEKRFFHFELGFTNRLAIVPIQSTTYTMAATGVGLRIEFFRFYVGAGYSPLAFTTDANQGFSHLKLNQNVTVTSFEGGMIWRLVPELHITFGATMDYGTTPSGQSPAPLTSYGLCFRFPINPKADTAAKSVKYDGWRYPFGVMRE